MFRRACLALLLLSTSAPAALVADDLTALAGKFRRAVQSVVGPPQQRAERVAQQVVPVLEEIAAVDTDASLQFLLGQLRSAKPAEVAAACAAPVLKSSNDRAPARALAEFPRLQPLARKALLEAVAASDRDFSSVESELLRIAKGGVPDLVKPALPGALAKVPSARSAKSVVGLLASSRKRRGAGESPLVAPVYQALLAMKTEDVDEWLASDALSSTRSAEGLTVVLRVIAEREIQASGKSLVKLVAHRDDAVAGAAIRALAKVGLDGVVDDVEKQIKRRRGSSAVQFRIDAFDALASSGNSAALAVVIQATQGRDPTNRSIAYGSLRLAAADEPKALDALLGGLKDDDASARLVALRALTGLKRKAMIGPMIEALDGDEHYSFRVKVLEFLVQLTHQNMGLVVEDWRKWWDVAERGFEFPKAEDKKFTSVKTYDLSYFGIEISSKRLGFIVDISSSMTQEVAVKRREKDSGETTGGKGRTTTGRRRRGGDDGDDGLSGDRARKIDVLKVELARVIEKLPADVLMNVVTFDATPRQWQKQLQPLRGRGRAKALDFAKSIQTGRGTNVYDSLEKALEDKRVDTVYLMTDGQPSAGKYTKPDDILREIRKKNRLRAITIHCIAFGEESPFLEKLAAENGGKYRFVNEY